MADEKVEFADNKDLPEEEGLIKEKKGRKSKKWRKKSSKKDSPPLRKQSTKGDESLDLTDAEPGKAADKEKKSFKERIRKISLRKVAKNEKRDKGDDSDEKPEEIAKEDVRKLEAESEEVKLGEISNGIPEKEGGEVEQKVKSVGGEREEELGHVESENECRKIEKTEEQDENAATSEQCNDLDEKCFSTSTEVQKMEVAEREKSKEHFDAVIVELTTKDLTPVDESNKESKASEGDKNGETVLEEIEEESLQREVSEGMEMEQSEFNVETQDCDDEKAEDERKDDEGESDAIPLAESEESEGANDAEVQSINAEKKDGSNTFRPIKEESLDLSQKIAKKAVGKVVGRYRQVHLTKTYCQCCSVM